MKKTNFDDAMEEILAVIFADGYKETGLKYEGADVYIATFNKPVCIGNPWFILREEDEVWLANDNEIEKLVQLYEWKEQAEKMTDQELRESIKKDLTYITDEEIDSYMATTGQNLAQYRVWLNRALAARRKNNPNYPDPLKRN